MLRRLLAPALLLAVLTACSRAPEPAAPAADAAAAPAAATAAPVEAAAVPAQDAGASAPAGDANAATAAPDTAPEGPVVPPAAASGPAPRLGTDYVVLESPQPLWSQAPKFEIAEVFSYRCIHCAEFQPKVNEWHKRMPSDARWEYVPGVFGGSWDDFARAYFAAEVLGVRERTHDNVFHGVFVDQYIKGDGGLPEIAAMYSRWGVDKAQFLDTMQSFGVTAKLNRAKQFAQRTGVDATPTIILNGKYRVSVTTDRGFDGMLSTVEWLLARERAAAAGAPAAGTPPAAG